MRRCSVAKRRALALLLCLLLLLCTACGGQAQEDAGALHCTVRIECSTVLAHMDDLKAGKADIVPSDGVLLPETTVAFSEGDTVFDVLQQVCRAQGIHMESTWTPAYNSAYIEGIGNLYEFDCEQAVERIAAAAAVHIVAHAVFVRALAHDGVRAEELELLLEQLFVERLRVLQIRQTAELAQV